MKERLRRARIPLVMFGLAVLIGSMSYAVPLYADGIDELGSKLVETLTPVFSALQKISWVVGAICIVVALINVIISPGKGSQTSWMWIKGILIAVALIQVVTGILSYAQSSLNETELNKNLTELTTFD